MADGYQDDYRPHEVPGGVLAFTKAIAIADGTTIGITPSHKAYWAKVKHVGTGGELVLANSEEGFGEGLYWPIGSTGAVEVLSAVDASRRFVLGAVGAGVSARVVLSLTRQSVQDGHPELLADLGFPRYNAADSDNIVPGVDE